MEKGCNLPNPDGHVAHFLVAVTAGSIVLLVKDASISR